MAEAILGPSFDKAGAAVETARIHRLRERMLVRPAACIERLRCMTQVFRETEGRPVALRRALALKRLMETLTLCIPADEFIVGRPTSKRRGSPYLPEVRDDWYLQEIDTISTREIDVFEPVPPDERRELDDLIPYWHGRSIFQCGNNSMPEGMFQDYSPVIGGGVSANNHYHAHSSVDYTVLLAHGPAALIAALDEKIAAVRLDDVDQYAARVNWEASKLCVEAFAILANRYADEAGRLAALEQDPVRADELRRIAANCRHLAVKPAETFEQAVQCVWFTFILLMNEAWGNAVGFMRPDQYLYPYYKRDREAGTLTQNRAYELVGMLLVKANETVILYGKQGAANMAGFCTGSNFVLGGVKADGSDAVNELSWLFVDAEEEVGLNSEEIVIRVSDRTPDRFLLRCCEVAKQLCGKFKFIGDETVVRMMQVDGRSLEDARNFVIIGCTSPSVPGRSLDWLHSSISIAHVLELALRDGVSNVNGKQIGPHTGDPRGFTSYEQLWDAFRRQLAAIVPVARLRGNLEIQNFARLAPNPFQSLLCPPCFASGIDVIDGGTLPNLTLAISVRGLVNVADALAAMKRIVFEKKQLSMERLLAACAADFVGYEDVLALIERQPKFGNDDDYVDSIMEELLTLLDETPTVTHCYKGGKLTVCAATVTSNVPLGRALGAQPDGRRAGAPLAEGGLSPHQGRNTHGITATLNSVGKLDHMKVRHGSVLNLRIDPETVKNEDKLNKLAQMMRAYFRMGGFLVQFNFVSTEILRDAKLHPENYRDLVVRVATYSAYFVELSEAMQDDIIARLEQKSL